MSVPSLEHAISASELENWLQQFLQLERDALVTSLNQQILMHHGRLVDSVSPILCNMKSFQPSKTLVIEEAQVANTSVTSEAKLLENNIAAWGTNNRASTQDTLAQDTSAQPPYDKTRYASKKLRELAGVNIEVDEKDGCLTRFVKGNIFESISACLVMACTLIMAAQIQYNGYQTGYELQMKDFEKPAHQVWPGAAEIFEVAEASFNVLFTIELVLRLYVLKMRAYKSGWFQLDVVLVSVSWVDYLGLLSIGLDPMVLRLVRIVRLVRLLKVVKSLKMVETLFLLIKSIQSSFGALLWSFTLLWLLQISMGVVLCQLLTKYVNDTGEDPVKRKAVFNYFGTFTSATLTMFEISLANWVPSCRLLYHDVSEWYGLFFILYRCCFMFAVMKVITAVFIAETNRCAMSDDELAMTRKHRQKEAYIAKLREVFVELDESGDGQLSWTELEPLITDNLILTWLHTLDIDTQDLHTLFAICDNGDAKFDLDEFITGLSRVRGPAKSIDVLKVMRTVTIVNSKIDSLETHIRQMTSAGTTKSEESELDGDWTI